MNCVLTNTTEYLLNSVLIHTGLKDRIRKQTSKVNLFTGYLSMTVTEERRNTVDITLKP